jgi:hypothetical protein
MRTYCFTFMKQMLRGSRKGILIAIIVLSLFLFFTFAVLFSYHSTTETGETSPFVMPLIKYHIYFMMSLAAVGVAVGAAVFYFMSTKVDDTRGVAKESAEIMLRFLNAEERKVVQVLVEEQGKVLQAELTRLPGMNRLKVHRILSKLAEKDIVTIDSHGKTNTVRLKPDIYKALS